MESSITTINKGEIYPTQNGYKEKGKQYDLLTYFFHARFIHGDELRDHLKELDPSQETVVYCLVGLRGYLAARILLHHGFTKVSNLTGGYLSFP